MRKPSLKFKGHTDLVGELRQRKDREEVKRIQKAINRAEESFRELKKYIRPGAREMDLALVLEFLMREKGAKKPAFDSIVSFGHERRNAPCGGYQPPPQTGRLGNFRFWG